MAFTKFDSLPCLACYYNLQAACKWPVIELVCANCVDGDCFLEGGLITGYAENGEKKLDD